MKMKMDATTIGEDEMDEHLMNGEEYTNIETGNEDDKRRDGRDEDEENSYIADSSSGEGYNIIQKKTISKAKNGKNRNKCFNTRRICVKMIDYSNIHPLQTFLPIMKEQRMKQEKEKEKGKDKDKDTDNEAEKFIWLDEDVDNEQHPDHGVLLGLECMCLLLKELQNSGTIKKRSDEEWLEIMRTIPCYEKALKPLMDALQNVENKTNIYD